MTGQGGWPLNAFLTPEQAPFYAGTYFPPEPRHGMPSWRTVLEAVAEAWRTAPRRGPRAGRPGRSRRSAATARLDAVRRSRSPTTLLTEAVDGLRRLYDRVNGGFGGAPKFPPASLIEFLLVARRARDVAGDAARDGAGRHLRPGRRRLCPLRGRRDLDRAALREDALRQRAAGARLPARLAGVGRRAPAARLLRDARLGAARDARPRGRLLLGARRRLRGRRGQVLRVDARRAARGARRSSHDAAIAYFGGRSAATSRARNVLEGRGPEPERARRRSAHAATTPARAGAPGARRQAADLVERADDLGAGRGRRGARARRLPRRRGRAAPSSCSATLRDDDGRLLRT